MTIPQPTSLKPAVRCSDVVDVPWKGHREIADWIQKIFGVNRASAELAANRYLTGTMAPCLLLNDLEQAFPNERGML